MIIPDVSVIVCSYNHAKWIERCIRSLCHQSLIEENAYEIIVVNDASNDLTEEILQKFKSAPNVKLITNKENLGLPASINIGMKRSEGRYVVRVDSDDYVARTFLYFLSTFLNYNKEYQGVASDYLIVNENEEIISKENGMLCEIACGVMYRRECLFDVGLYNEKFKMREGHELRRRFLEKFSIGRLEFPLYKYRMHNSNRTLDNESVAVYDQMLQNGKGRK